MIFKTQVNLLGFSITESTFSKESDCEKINSFPFQLSLILNNLNDKENTEFLVRCFKDSRGQFRILYDLLAYDNISLESLKLYLDSRKVAPTRQKIIIQIYKAKRDREKEKEKVLALENALAIDEKQDYSSRFKSANKIRKSFPKLNSGVWNNLLSLILAQKMNNLSWSKSEMQMFLKQNPDILTFGFNRLWIKDSKERDKFKKIIEDALLFAKETMEREEEQRVFDSVINMGTMNITKKFQEYSWSLDSVRSLIKERDPLIKYMNYWSRVIGNRVSRTELFNYLDQTMNKVYLMSFDKGDLPVLIDYFPNDEARRLFIKNALGDYVNDKDLYTKWMLLRLAETPVVKEWLSDFNDDYHRALFLLKRNFFKDLLESGYATEYAIYNLMLLGDRNIEYLWWLCL